MNFLLLRTQIYLIMLKNVIRVDLCMYVVDEIFTKFKKMGAYTWISFQIWPRRLWASKIGIYLRIFSAVDWDYENNGSAICREIFVTFLSFIQNNCQPYPLKFSKKKIFIGYLRRCQYFTNDKQLFELSWKRWISSSPMWDHQKHPSCTSVFSKVAIILFCRSRLERLEVLNTLPKF